MGEKVRAKRCKACVDASFHELGLVARTKIIGLQVCSVFSNREISVEPNVLYWQRPPVHQIGVKVRCHSFEN